MVCVYTEHTVLLSLTALFSFLSKIKYGAATLLKLDDYLRMIQGTSCAWVKKYLTICIKERVVFT